MIDVLSKSKFSSVRYDILGIKKYEKEFAELTDESLREQVSLLKSKQALSQDDYNLILAIGSLAIQKHLLITPYNVQFKGAILLYSNKIVEMQTGEGKTIAAVLAALMNAVSNYKTHIITVNEYLVYRDYKQMKPVFDMVGISLGYTINSHEFNIKKENYACEVLYATSSEIGFDYLRDSLTTNYEDQINISFDRAIVDEADSNMLDEAVTPLVISNNTNQNNADKFIILNDIVKRYLSPDDYQINYNRRYTYLTSNGYKKVANALFNEGHLKPVPGYEFTLDNATLLLTNTLNISYIYYLNACLQARTIYVNGVDYLIDNNGNVNIVSDKTGRIMPGRRWSDGIHQAIEAKENVKVQEDSVTAATITLQYLFKSYRGLSGMTGTALTDIHEFKNIYKIECYGLETNKPSKRQYLPDSLFLTKVEKNKAIIDNIIKIHQTGQPILIGTPSVIKSEELSQLLSKEKIEHKVLNAKYISEEANIIAQAGKLNSVTIATNMAGRGTDILLGGNVFFGLNIADLNSHKISELLKKQQLLRDEVCKLGGLFVIGSERNLLRRIDNQLAGRAGRQGDPGIIKFYLSLEDDLLNIFSADQINQFKFDHNMFDEITVPWFNLDKIIFNTQQRYARQNFDSRKQLEKEDAIVNEKRKLYYSFRNSIFSDSITIYDLFTKQLIPQVAKTLTQKNVNYSELVNILNQQYDVKDIITKLPEYLKNLNSQETKYLRNLYIITLADEWLNFPEAVNFYKKSSYLISFAQKDSNIVFEENINEAFSNLYNEVSIKMIIRAYNLSLIAVSNQ